MFLFRHRFFDYRFSSGICAALLIFSCSCNNTGTQQPPAQEETIAPPMLTYKVVATYPHDTGAYTQGLIWHNGMLIEGTGQIGESNLRKVELNTGKVMKQVDNAPDVFGEGVTLLNGKIYQITWRNGKGFVYDAATLARLKEFPINTEGWGLTHNGRELIYSDGSNNLYFLDTATFRELRRVGVTDNYGPVGNLNELEWIDGKIWANRYQTDLIYQIDPESGYVVGKADFSGLKEQFGFSVKDPLNEVLNGIAWDSTGKRMFITGKYWPKLFEVKMGE